MGIDDLNIIKEHKEDIAKSREILSNMTALDMSKKAILFQNELDSLITKMKLPVSIIVGVLVCEINKVFTESDIITTVGFEALEKYIDEKFFESKHYVDTNNAFLKKYMEGTFIRKEKEV